MIFISRVRIRTRDPQSTDMKAVASKEKISFLKGLIYTYVYTYVNVCVEFNTYILSSKLRKTYIFTSFEIHNR